LGDTTGSVPGVVVVVVVVGVVVVVVVVFVDPLDWPGGRGVFFLAASVAAELDTPQPLTSTALETTAAPMAPRRTLLYIALPTPV